MAEVVFLLCALTSIACAVLLLRAYRRTRMQLLFWSGTAFLAFALANVLLFADFVLVPNLNLLLVRQCINLGGVMLLVYGLIRTH